MKVKKIGEKLSRGKMYSWDSESVKIFEESWGSCESTPSTPTPSRYSTVQLLCYDPFLLVVV